MSKTPCRYILFGNECRSESLKGAMRRLIRELYARYPQATERAAKGPNLGWLHFSRVDYRPLPFYFSPTGLNRSTIRSWSRGLLKEMWLSEEAFQVISIGQSKGTK